MLSTLVNYEEASAYCRAIKVPVVRELASLVFGVLTKKYLKGDLPTGAFDALFLVKTLEEAFSSQEVIAGLLRGETMMWPVLETDESAPSLSKAERDELERRLISLTENPADVVSWDEVKSRAMARFQK